MQGRQLSRNGTKLGRTRLIPCRILLYCAALSVTYAMFYSAAMLFPRFFRSSALLLVLNQNVTFF